MFYTRKMRLKNENHSKNQLLIHKYFYMNSTYLCAIDDESFFTVESNTLILQSDYESEDHPAPKHAKFVCKTKFQTEFQTKVARRE
jgi:hypothetical protein